MSAAWTDEDERRHQAEVEAAAAPQGMRPKLWNWGDEPAFKAHLTGLSDERLKYERDMRSRILPQKAPVSALSWGRCVPDGTYEPKRKAA